MAERKGEYALRRRLRGEWCVYCGEPATAEDHFPPFSLMLAGWLLPVCLQCNGIAGTVWSRDFDARCAHVNKRLRQLLRRLLETPEWSKDEIGTLGHTLGSAVVQWEQRRKIARARIAWNAAIYIASIDRDNAFALWRAEIASTTRNGRKTLRSTAGIKRRAKRLDASPAT